MPEQKFDRVNRWLTLGANLGVIAGIIFLGFELHQNNRLMAEQARSVRINFRLDITESLYSDPELARIVTAAAAGEPLSAQDAFRHHYLATAVLVAWEHVYREYEKKLLNREDIPDADWRAAFDKLAMAGPWRATKRNFDADFAAFMDANIVGASEGENAQ